MTLSHCALMFFCLTFGHSVTPWPPWQQGPRLSCWLLCPGLHCKDSDEKYSQRCCNNSTYLPHRELQSEGRLCEFIPVWFLWQQVFPFKMMFKTNPYEHLYNNEPEHIHDINGEFLFWESLHEPEDGLWIPWNITDLYVFPKVYVCAFSGEGVHSFAQIPKGSTASKSKNHYGKIRKPCHRTAA